MRIDRLQGNNVRCDAKLGREGEYHSHQNHPSISRECNRKPILSLFLATCCDGGLLTPSPLLLCLVGEMCCAACAL